MARQMKNGRTARAVRKGGDFAAHNLIATWEGGDFAAHKSIAAMLIGFRGIGVALVSPIGIWSKCLLSNCPDLEQFKFSSAFITILPRFIQFDSKCTTIYAGFIAI